MEALIVALSSNETPTWRKPQVFRNRNIESSLFVMQVFHMCQPNGESTAFLCPNGTMFNQQYFVCDWWYNLGKRASYTHTETTTCMSPSALINRAHVLSPLISGKLRKHAGLKHQKLLLWKEFKRLNLNFEVTLFKSDKDHMLFDSPKHACSPDLPVLGDWVNVSSELLVANYLQ